MDPCLKCVYERSYCFEDLLLLGKCIFGGFLSLFNWFWLSIFFKWYADLKCYSIFTMVFTFVQLITLAFVRDDCYVSSPNFGQIPDGILHLCTLFGGGPVAAYAIVFYKHRDKDSFYQKTFLDACCCSLLTTNLIGLCILVVFFGFHDTCGAIQSWMTISQ